MSPNPSGGVILPPVNATELERQQQIVDALEKLNREVNNTEVSKLADELREGNYREAQLTLDKLKASLESQALVCQTSVQNQTLDCQSASANITPSLKALIDSLDCSNDACTVDWTALERLLDPYATTDLGVPRGISEMEPLQAASALDTLAELSRTEAPHLSQILQMDALQIRQALSPIPRNFHGPTIPPITPPNPGSNPLPLWGQPPALSTSPWAVPTPGGAGILKPPSPSELAIPLTVLGLAAAAVIASRRGQAPWRKTVQDPAVVNEPVSSLDPRNPRQAIILYFRRAVELMRKRGVSKLFFETHREFSQKCAKRPEESQVGRVSGLYEKAMFSGREVTSSEADEARDQVAAIEKAPVKKRG